MVSTYLKNISYNGNLPQIGVKIENSWNHHLVIFRGKLAVSFREGIIKKTSGVDVLCKRWTHDCAWKNHLGYTPKKTNIAPENRPSHKETRIPTIHFQVPNYSSIFRCKMAVRSVSFREDTVPCKKSLKAYTSAGWNYHPMIGDELESTPNHDLPWKNGRSPFSIL